MRTGGRVRGSMSCGLLLTAGLVGGCATGTAPADGPDPPTSAAGSAGSSASPPASSPTDPISAQARTAARAFVAFAEGDPSTVPWAARVRYHLNGRRVATLEGRRAVDPGAWDTCLPGATRVEGRDCPVSVLATVARESRAGELPLQATAPREVGCTRVAPLRLERDVESVTIRQRAGERSCFGDVAATLLLDRRGRVVAVDFVLSGP